MEEKYQNLIGCEFRHFKGNRYRLEGFAKDSETMEELVVYRALYGDGGLWVRPAEMFFETIERDGKRMKRFELDPRSARMPAIRPSPRHHQPGRACRSWHLCRHAAD